MVPGRGGISGNFKDGLIGGEHSIVRNGTSLLEWKEKCKNKQEEGGRWNGCGEEKLKSTMSVFSENPITMKYAGLKLGRPKQRRPLWVAWLESPDRACAAYASLPSHSLSCLLRFLHFHSRRDLDWKQNSKHNSFPKHLYMFPLLKLYHSLLLITAYHTATQIHIQ